MAALDITDQLICGQRDNETGHPNHLPHQPLPYPLLCSIGQAANSCKIHVSHSLTGFCLQEHGKKEETAIFFLLC